MEISKDTINQTLYKFAIYELCRLRLVKNKSKLFESIKEYISELINNLEYYNKFSELVFMKNLKPKEVEILLLRGAKNWNQYSRGGLSLFCNEDISKRCEIEENLKKIDNIEDINWLDIQKERLSLAASCILKGYKTLKSFAL